MTRVIVHAGFHKTGTSSLQDYLGKHYHALLPWFTFYGTGDALHRSAVASRIFAKKPFPWRRRAVRRALRADLAALPDAEVIVLSREHYSGVMPGLRDWLGRVIPNFHRAAKPLAKLMISELRHRFGQDVEITFFYTTRKRGDWLASVHGHLLRVIELTDDFDSFATRFRPDMGPENEAGIMRRALAPIPVVTAALEDWGTSHCGPAGALLTLIGVPEDVQAALPPANIANAGHDPRTRDALLSLNREDLSKPALRERKDLLLKGH
ncbi:hypothetical protein [Maritimibacter dapengensis]|uniref:Sulfotransferase family protein n=1 Tax=Maritimibacter dapengensis TaxID=2836868 RepID=A0ABS6SZM7_9RHOB|nr:hypothetical protein [Maritimibacter dapengensis]MBV7377741.1 hypothetical protein [Maritimibacter dapengensis]